MTQPFGNPIISLDVVLKQIQEQYGIILQNLNKAEKLYLIKHISMSILNDMKGQTTKSEHPDFKAMCKRDVKLIEPIKQITASVSTKEKEELLVAIIKDIDRVKRKN